MEQTFVRGLICRRFRLYSYSLVVNVLYIINKQHVVFKGVCGPVFAALYASTVIRSWKMHLSVLTKQFKSLNNFSRTGQDAHLEVWGPLRTVVS